MSKFWIFALIPAFALTPAFAQDEDPKKRVDALVTKLGDKNIEIRHKAVDDLVKIGRPALKALRKALKSGDLEVKALAEKALEGIEWRGLAKLKEYVGQMYADGATVEQAKLKALLKWFPETRFYEVKAGAAAAAAGPAAMMGMRQAPRSLFAIKQFDDGFTRVIVKGVYSAPSFGTLIKGQRIILKDADTALDFALAYMEAQSTPAFAAMMMRSMGGAGGGRFEKVDGGWKLEATGNSLFFEVDKEGVLLQIRTTSKNYWQTLGLGGNNTDPSEEKLKLELEKLRLEVELLKKQLGQGEK